MRVSVVATITGLLIAACHVSSVWAQVRPPKPEEPKRILLQTEPLESEWLKPKRLSPSVIQSEMPLLKKVKPFYPPPKDWWILELVKVPISLLPTKEQVIAENLNRIREEAIYAARNAQLPSGYSPPNPAAQAPQMTTATLGIPVPDLSPNARQIQPSGEVWRPLPPAKLPSSAEEYYAWAQFFVADQRLIGALHDLSEAIRLKPDYFAAIFLRAEVYFRLESFDLAVEDYTRALLLREHDAVYVRRAEAFRALARYKDAEADYQKALSLNPSNETARMALELLQEETGP
ncbi:MAG: tetratricopeptide repeat protein [Chloroherpetonaceae bacterium]|nr:tetratricopeptide repeat protein [Chloroherpetonaceae bacterium]